MDFPAALPSIATKTAEVVDTLMSQLRPRLLEAAFSGDFGENQNTRHKDNFLSVHDMWMHERYRESIGEYLGSFVYASEESDPQVIGNEAEPDLCVLVDPLDTSELAVRGLLGYTHIMIYSRTLGRPIAAIVGDIYHHVRFYIAARCDDGQDRAFAVTADGSHHLMTAARKPKHLAESLVTNFLMRPAERFIPLSRQRRLMDALDQTGSDGKSRGRIGVDFGSVSLCHVAAGFTEAVIEFAKGFAIWDLAPGHFILNASGGTVLDLEGRPVPLNYGLDSFSDIATAMTPRQKFVAAGSDDLANEILHYLDV
jgi:myo-inositol-1(or 4)-monophosphatase